MSEPQRKIIDMTADEYGVFGFQALSFVDNPATQAGFIHLSEMLKLSMFDEEKRIVYGPILIPDQLIFRVDDKTNEEFYIRFNEETIKNVAYGMMHTGSQANHTVMHAVPVDGCTIVETWLKHSDVDKSVSLGFDSSFAVGTWFVGTRVDNKDVWKDIKSGKLRGYSIEAMMANVDAALMQDSAMLLEIENALRS